MSVFGNMIFKQVIKLNYILADVKGEIDNSMTIVRVIFING